MDREQLTSDVRRIIGRADGADAVNRAAAMDAAAAEIAAMVEAAGCGIEPVSRALEAAAE